MASSSGCAMIGRWPTKRAKLSLTKVARSLLPLEHGDHARRLTEQPVEFLVLRQRLLVGLLDGLGILPKRQFCGRRMARKMARRFHLSDRGHVVGVLDHVDRPALGIEKRRVHRAPIADFPSATMRGRAVDLVGNQCDSVRLTGLECGLDGSKQPLLRVAALRKHVEQPVADQLVPAPHRHLFIGLIDRDEAQLAIKDHVRRRAEVEDAEEIDARWHCADGVRWTGRAGMRLFCLCHSMDSSRMVAAFSSEPRHRGIRGIYSCLPVSGTLGARNSAWRRFVNHDG
ncbi:hypothetical protein OH818_23965 [Jiella pelagia]|uniref:Uncharacterized protein n=1 Tax=Jiella pelagia TaxID=2986949 RepID=A0ABY7BZ21_9HYPH|nr:hypothetical protein [Jiella pelagia]WAP68355.1 hypothetical protein OH818_23965 [Jiella pelagia]